MTQQATEGASTQQAKQALVQAVRFHGYMCGCAAHREQTNNFRDNLKEAKETASSLPGGELSVEEQDEVIAMLERLKARKKCVYILSCSR